MFAQVALIVAAGLLGPIMAAGRRALVPVLVGELAAGAIIGRTGFSLVDPTQQPLPALYQIGFALVMFAAGTHIDLASTDLRRGVVRGLVAVAAVSVLAVPAGWALSTLLGVGNPPLVAVLLAGSSAAVAFPIMEERGMTGPSVSLLVAWIALADVVTVLVMPLTLTGAPAIPRALLGDGLIIVAGLAVAVVVPRLLATHPAVAWLEQSIERGWALQLRLSILLLLILAAIAAGWGGSGLVAGFTAGMVLRRLREPERLQLQLSGLANGFFVPAFFVLLGATIDLRALAASPSAIGLAVAMAASGALIRVVGALLVGRERRLATGLMASAQLGLPAAAASLGLSSGRLTPALAAALVAGACLTLIPASIGGVLFTRHRDGRGAVAA